MIAITLTFTPFSFADEAPNEQEIVCMNSEDRAPCRFTDYNGVFRTGNCEDQYCVPHCPEGAEEGSECTFIYGSGEVNQGVCNEGTCDTSEVTGGGEATGGEVAGGESNGGASLSDVLGTGGDETSDMPAEQTENREGEAADDADSEDEGCQQGASALSLAPLSLIALMLLGLVRRRATL